MYPNIAAVGFGYWGKNLIRNFYRIGALRTICDTAAGRENLALSEYPDLRFCSVYDEVLEDSSIQAVALATPAVTHYSMALAALRAGKDVFVEKPMALTMEEGQMLADYAASHSRILMVGHILQYHPAVLRLKELIKAGELGQVRYLYSNRLNIGKIRSEENILWSFAPHDISVILALLGEEPAEIHSTGGSYLHAGVADITLSELKFASGVRAHIFVSWLHPFKEQRLIVVGSEKMAVFEDSGANKLVLYPHRVEWKDRIPTAVKADGVPVAIDSVEPLLAECEHFLHCVVSRETPRTDSEEALRVLRVLTGCQRSLETNETVRPFALAAQKNRPYFVHSTATIDEPCEIGSGTKIWHFSHILRGAKIGNGCIFGQNCSVAEKVIIGNNVKVQNNISIYAGTVIEDDVFLGPSCVLTNVTNPRSQINRHSLYEKTILRRGATVGANATLICGIELGRYCFVGAGSVVAKDVPDYALVVGNPARQVGWMSRHGHRLTPGPDRIMVCPESGLRYREISPGVLRCLDLEEDAPLPEHLTKGAMSYDEFKKHTPEAVVESER